MEIKRHSVTFKISKQSWNKDPNPDPLCLMDPQSASDVNTWSDRIRISSPGFVSGCNTACFSYKYRIVQQFQTDFLCTYVLYVCNVLYSVILHILQDVIFKH